MSSHILLLSQSLLPQGKSFHRDCPVAVQCLEDYGHFSRYECCVERLYEGENYQPSISQPGWDTARLWPLVQRECVMWPDLIILIDVSCAFIVKPYEYVLSTWWSVYLFFNNIDVSWLWVNSWSLLNTLNHLDAFLWARTQLWQRCTNSLFLFSHSGPV